MNTRLSRMFPSAGRSIMVSLIAVGAVMVSGSARGDDLPRYKLKVGQELKYVSVALPDESNDDGRRSRNSTVEWTLTTLRQNPDGGWRVLFRKETRSGPREASQAGYFDMTPDGKITENRTITVHANPTPLFPALPPDDAAMNGTWSSTVSIDETTRDFTAPDGPPPPDARDWTFEEDTHGVFEPIYLISRHYEYEFDMKHGLVRKITGTATQGWPPSIAGRTTKSMLALAEQRQIDSPELTALDKEMSRYFDLTAAYDQVMAKKDFTNTAETLDKAESLLKSAQDKFELPAVQAMLKNKLESLVQARHYYLDDAKRFAKLIGKPSDEWQTEDLEGHPRSLADYKGKVVLLDFWYRGCGWCIRAMPQLKQLSDEFPKDQVAVIGMNNDRNLDDAKLVIDKMGLNYQTLKNGGHEDDIHKKYGVHGWPTLVILDGQGVVRDVHVGYSPTLREELGKKIRELLDEKVAVTPK